MADKNQAELGKIAATYRDAVKNLIAAAKEFLEAEKQFQNSVGAPHYATQLETLIESQHDSE